MIDTFMQRAAEYGQFNGAILVIDRGQRVYERAFGEANLEWHIPNTVDTRFEIASGCIALIAFGAGGWSVDAIRKKAQAEAAV